MKSYVTVVKDLKGKLGTTFAHAQKLERSAKRRACELRQVKTSLREMLDAYWGEGDAHMGYDAPPAFIERAIRLSNYRPAPREASPTQEVAQGLARYKEGTHTRIGGGKPRKHCCAQFNGAAYLKDEARMCRYCHTPVKEYDQ